MIPAFLFFLSSPPRSFFPSRCLPPHSSLVFISSSLRQNKLQPKASTFQTFNATQGPLSLPHSASMSLFRTYAQESTCLSLHVSFSLSLCYTQESACLLLFLSLCLRGEWDKVHWEQNNRTETQTKDFFGGSSLSSRNPSLKVQKLWSLASLCKWLARYADCAVNIYVWQAEFKQRKLPKP